MRLRVRLWNEMGKEVGVNVRILRDRCWGRNNVRNDKVLFERKEWMVVWGDWGMSEERCCLLE